MVLVDAVIGQETGKAACSGTSSRTGNGRATDSGSGNRTGRDERTDARDRHGVVPARLAKRIQVRAIVPRCPPAVRETLIGGSRSGISAILTSVNVAPFRIS